MRSLLEGQLQGQPGFLQTIGFVTPPSLSLLNIFCGILHAKNWPDPSLNSSISKVVSGFFSQQKENCLTALKYFKINRVGCAFAALQKGPGGIVSRPQFEEGVLRGEETSAVKTAMA